MIELVEKYHDVYKKRVTKSTFESNKYHLYGFMRCLTRLKIKNLADVNLDVMESWLEYLTQDKKNSPNTMNKKVTAVRYFYKWLVDEELVLCNPIPDDFYKPKLVEKVRRVPGKKATSEVIRKSQWHHINAVRNRAIIELCYVTGMRRMELRSLNLNDACGDEIRITGKGNKERIVPMGRKAWQWLVRYIQGERKNIINRHNPFEEALFVGVGGSRLCLGAYNVIMRKQVKSKYGLHSLRHACATHMLENGANIVVLQKLLGHERLSTTQRYTKVRPVHLKAMLEKCHPRG
jgi:site-specific recombinase XerD